MNSAIAYFICISFYVGTAGGFGYQPILPNKVKGRCRRLQSVSLLPEQYWQFRQLQCRAGTRLELAELGDPAGLRVVEAEI